MTVGRQGGTVRATAANLGEKMRLRFGFGAINVTGILLMGLFFGAGIAAGSPDWSGQTYSHAAEDIPKWGYKVAIAGVIGDQLPLDDCIVTRSPKAIKLDSSGRSTTSQISLYLNCNVKLAEPGKPGNSAASPEGRQTKNDLAQLNYFNDNPEKCSAPLDQYCKVMCNKNLDHCSAAVQQAIASF
ncbi:hypothetical protein [Mycolicibacterium rhodesiae]|uniref:hypothetical protein n=1 Tax=Mycolicibacterium rhodesiae TaxID=36814 RepID=UPI0010545D5C|nr:hypothetical protein [Mycolicibacterium rhodesiae]MCV7345439.1 hypothetical protein [Mycolicibacterium rhodesiae]